MLRSERRDRARTRMTYTGEPLCVASRHLAQIGSGGQPIPAATPEQAALETRLMAAWGYTEYHAWDAPFELGDQEQGPAYPPFGFRYVIPLPDELQVILHPDLLPQFVRRVLPMVESGGEEVYGVAGLRADAYDRHVLLTRPGFSGRIKVLVRRPQWEAAVTRALDGVERSRVGWIARPHDWTLEEIRFIDRYGRLFDYGWLGNSFVSGVLRRCHALSGGSYTRYWHLWMDNVIKLEWRGGVTHQVVIDRLLDREFGLEASLEDESWRCRCKETEGNRHDTCYWATVTSRHGLQLDLRRYALRYSP